MLDNTGYNSLNQESMAEGTSLLPDINAHKVKPDVNGILDSDEDEMTFKEFQLSRMKGAKSVANYEPMHSENDKLPSAEIAISEKEKKGGKVMNKIQPVSENFEIPGIANSGSD